MSEHDFRLTSERIAPDAVADVEAVLRTAEWVRNELFEDPEEVAKITRGVGLVRKWLRDLLTTEVEDE